MKKVLAVTCLFAVAGCNQMSPQGTSAMVPVGRFVIVHSPHIERDTTLLDTVTGRTWQLVVDKDENEVWQEFGQVNGQPLISN